METKTWLINWFVEHSAQSMESLNEQMTVNYMEAGLIDSFAFVMLLSDIDDEYDIAFSNKDFQNPSFFTIAGLTALIDEQK